jgi:hypothetical protein
MTRRRKAIGLGAALLLTLVSVLGWRSSSAQIVTESTERAANYYFRLKASYTHAGKPIDFDIVVACGIRVDRYRSGDSGFLAARYPRFFVKETHDGHAVMQIVPIACRGETTTGGEVPEDFLPGVIWFDKPGDYRFGIAYFSEDAFENPNSQLKFRGASIAKATRAEWEVFDSGASGNEGMKRRYYDGPFYSTDDAKRIALADGREVEAAYARSCSGVIRFKLSMAARQAIRKYWPSEKPEFWISGDGSSGPWNDLDRLRKTTQIFADGYRYREHLNGGNYKYGGFPTRAIGGMINGIYPIIPSEIFPTRFDRGIPWVFNDDVGNSPYLTKDVEVNTGPGKGFLYCYTTLNPGEGKLEVPIPNFRSREARIRVDGKFVVTPKLLNSNWPSRFFERDEYLYVKFTVGLS